MRIEVPRSISEAPTDRLFVSVDIDGTLRQITGARAPTVGQGSGAGGSARTPSAYMMGNRNADDNQQTTIQVVLRANVGTLVHNYLAKQNEANATVDLDFRTFGPIQDEFPETFFTVANQGGAGGAKGLSEISKTGGGGVSLVLGKTGENLVEGGVLEVIDNTLSRSERDDFFSRWLEEVEDEYEPSDQAGNNPRFLVVSDILYNKDGLMPQAYIVGRGVINNWPNKGDAGMSVIDHAATLAKLLVVHRDQSVKWTARGSVGGFGPGFGEDSLLYTLDVTLEEAMPAAENIHSAEAMIGKPTYTV